MAELGNNPNLTDRLWSTVHLLHERLSAMSSAIGEMMRQMQNFAHMQGRANAILYATFGVPRLMRGGLGWALGGTGGRGGGGGGSSGGGSGGGGGGSGFPGWENVRKDLDAWYQYKKQLHTDWNAWVQAQHDPEFDTRRRQQLKEWYDYKKQLHNEHKQFLESQGGKVPDHETLKSQMVERAELKKKLFEDVQAHRKALLAEMFPGQGYELKDVVGVARTPEGQAELAIQNRIATAGDASLQASLGKFRSGARTLSVDTEYAGEKLTHLGVTDITGRKLGATKGYWIKPSQDLTSEELAEQAKILGLSPEELAQNLAGGMSPQDVLADIQKSFGVSLQDALLNVYHGSATDEPSDFTHLSALSQAGGGGELDPTKLIDLSLHKKYLSQWRKVHKGKASLQNLAVAALGGGEEGEKKLQELSALAGTSRTEKTGHRGDIDALMAALVLGEATGSAGLTNFEDLKASLTLGKDPNLAAAAGAASSAASISGGAPQQSAMAAELARLKDVLEKAEALKAGVPGGPGAAEAGGVPLLGYRPFLAEGLSQLRDAQRKEEKEKENLQGLAKLNEVPLLGYKSLGKAAQETARELKGATEEVDDFQDSVEKTAQDLKGFLSRLYGYGVIGTSILGGAAQTGSPDAFDFMINSFKLIVAQIGQSLVPLLVDMGAAFQRFYFTLKNVDGSMIASMTKWGLIAGASTLVVTKLYGLGKAIEAASVGVFALELSLGSLAGLLTAGVGIASAFALYTGMKKFSDLSEGVKEAGSGLSGTTMEEMEKDPLYKTIKGLINQDRSSGSLVWDAQRKEFTRNKNIPPARSEEFQGQTAPEILMRAMQEQWEDNQRREQYIEDNKTGIILRSGVKQILTIGQGETEVESLIKQNIAGRKRLNYLQAMKENLFHGVNAPDAMMKPEQRGMYQQLLLGISSTRAQASYSGIEDAYKRVQLEALGKDPITLELEQIRTKSLQEMLDQLRKLVTLTEEQKSAIRNFGFSAQ